MVYETRQGKGSTELAAYYHQNGKGTHAYCYFGVHRLRERQGFCYCFRVSAPGADRVSLVGEFNAWDPAAMQRIENTDVWELTVVADICPEGLRYKYKIERGEHACYKADPYARQSESGGEGASLIFTESHHSWRDREYLENRLKQYIGQARYSMPINIYEVILGDWLGQADPSLAPAFYRALGDLLSQYVADMGYTHVLLRQGCAQSGGKDGLVTLFAPDCALGTPDDFAYFVDRMHTEHIGVLLDLPCVYVGTHAGGLADFDFNGLYTSAQSGNRIFNYQDSYATALLYSSACFWISEYHVDGIYVDATDMQATASTGEFLRTLSASVRQRMPDALLILRADSYRGLTAVQDFGGIGYDFVVDNAAEHALADCFCMSQTLRLGRRAWQAVTERLYAEHTLLALSERLAWQGRSVLGNMNGTQSERFSAMRTLLLYMISLPAKTLSFMGNEIGSVTPYRRGEGVPWFLQELPFHADLQAYVRALGRFYLATPALWECDGVRDAIASVPLENAPDGVVAYKRFERSGREVCILLNFSQTPAERVRVRVGGLHPYRKTVFDTQNKQEQLFEADAEGWICLDLAGLSGKVLKPQAPLGGFWFENS